MDFDFEVKDEIGYAKFLKALKSVSKNETIEDKKRHIAILNTKQEVIGISMANIRAFAKKISKTCSEDFLEFSVSKNKDEEFYEETLIQGLVIAEMKDFQKQTFWFQKWIEKIDNWSTCDSVVTTLKNLKKSEEKKAYFDFYHKLCFSDKEFVARFGIVVLMVVFLDELHIDLILEMCKNISNDAYYVQMAIAWLVSMAYVKFKEKTEKLLKEKTLAKFVQNKAISKCHDSFQIEKEDKERLKIYRIK